MSTISSGTTSTTTLVHSGDTTGSLVFKTNDTGSGGTTAMTIDTSQNVGIGTTTPASDTANERIVQVNAPTTYSTLSLSTSRSNTDGQTIGKLSFDVLNNTATYRSRAQITSQSSGSTANKYGGNLIFFTASDNTTDATERMRITSGGEVNIGTTTTYANIGLTIQRANTADENLYLRNTASSGVTTSIQSTTFNSYSPNNTSARFLYCADTSAERCSIRSNGGIYNYQANNSNLSDRREKTNFAPAKSYLDTICAIPVQTFNYIDQNMEEDDGLTLGVVAQDVQEVAPELIHETNWGTKDEPKMRLSIYQTDLQYALMKSIQELKALVDAQATEIAELKAKVGA